MLKPTQPPIRPYIRTTNRIGWSMVLFFALFFGITVGTEIAFLNTDMTAPVTRAVYAICSSAAYVAPFLLAAGFFFRDRRSDADAIRRARIRTDLRIPAVFPLLILAALGINLASAYVNSFLCGLVGYAPTGTVDASGYDSAGSVIFYMTTAIAPAFAEEYLFRGVFYGHLRPFGKWQAVLVTSLAFSLMHQNVSQLFYTFVCGILLAFMCEYTGSIWCGVIFHLLNNELAVIAESLLYGSFGERAVIILTLWDVCVMLIGLTCTVILILLARRRGREASKAAATSPGVFGPAAPATATVEPWDTPLDALQVRRGLRTPGMLTFFILSALVILADYSTVVLASTGG